MSGDPTKMTVWTGYFDSRVSRSGGRRVAKDASIPQPTLDAVAWAANKVGIRKMKKQPEASHPSRPFAQEGRLIISTSDAKDATGKESKEGIMREIGVMMRAEMKRSREDGKTDTVPSRKSKQQRAQRKSFRQKGGSQKKRSLDGSDCLFLIEAGVPDVETYLKLRESAGMRARTHSGASKGLGSELFSVILRLEDSGEAVGMGRVVGDGGTVFHICDMAVSRDWQGKGGGSMIMDSLMGYISREASSSSYINLMADVDGFYEKWGFKPTLPNSRGMFVRLSEE